MTWNSNKEKPSLLSKRVLRTFRVNANENWKLKETIAQLEIIHGQIKQCHDADVRSLKQTLTGIITVKEQLDVSVLRRRFLAEHGYFMKERQINIRQFIESIDKIIYTRKGTRIPLIFRLHPKEKIIENSQEDNTPDEKTDKTGLMNDAESASKQQNEVNNGDKDEESMVNQQQTSPSERKPYHFRVIAPPINGRKIEAVYKEIEEEEKMLLKMKEMNDFRRRSANIELLKKKNLRSNNKKRGENNLRIEEEEEDCYNNSTKNKSNEDDKTIETQMHRIFITDNFSGEPCGKDDSYTGLKSGIFHRDDFEDEYRGEEVKTEKNDDSYEEKEDSKLICEVSRCEKSTTTRGKVTSNIRMSLQSFSNRCSGERHDMDRNSMRPASSPLKPAFRSKGDGSSEESTAVKKRNRSAVYTNHSSVQKRVNLRDSGRVAWAQSTQCVNNDPKDDKERRGMLPRPKSSLDGYSLLQQRKIVNETPKRRRSFSAQNSPGNRRKISTSRQVEKEVVYDARPRTAITKGYATVQMTVGKQSVSVYIPRFKKDTICAEQKSGRANAKSVFQIEQARIKRNRLTIAQQSE